MTDATKTPTEIAATLQANRSPKGRRAESALRNGHIGDGRHNDAARWLLEGLGCWKNGRTGFGDDVVRELNRSDRARTLRR